MATVLVLGFLAWALIDGWAAVSRYDWSIDVPLLLGGCAVLGAFYLASGLGYVGIVELLHRPAPPRPAMLSIWARSLLGRYVPGSVVMVVGRVVLSHERGVPRRTTLAATVYEQVLALAVAALGAVVFLAAREGTGGARPWLLGLVAVGALALHPRVFGPASGWVLRKARREPLERTIPAGPLAGLAAWYAATAALLGLGIWLVVRSAAGAEAGDPLDVGGAFLLSFAISLLAVVFPSGLGVREGVFAVALAQNVPGGVAVALAVGVRLVLTLVEVAFVAVGAALGRDR